MRSTASSFKLLSIPIVLYFVWSVISPRSTNPFEPLLFISHYIPDSSPSDPRYAKGWLDIPFLLYYVIVFSFIRQFVILKIIRPLSRWYGIRKEAKLDRLGEQGYAILYWGTMGVWGAVCTINSICVPVTDVLADDYEDPTHLVLPHRILLDWLVYCSAHC